MWERVKQWLGGRDRVIYNRQGSRALAEVLPADVWLDLQHRFMTQIPKGHTSLCDECGAVLLVCPEPGHLILVAEQKLLIPNDGITINSECKACGAVTELAK